MSKILEVVVAGVVMYQISPRADSGVNIHCHQFPLPFTGDASLIKLRYQGSTECLKDDCGNLDLYSSPIEIHMKQYQTIGLRMNEGTLSFEWNVGKEHAVMMWVACCDDILQITVSVCRLWVEGYVKTWRIPKINSKMT